jgi:hypothetical protein
LLRITAILSEEGNMYRLLLAQSAEPEKAIGWLQTIISGGVPLICLVTAAIFGYAAWSQYKKNMQLEITYRMDLAERAKQEKVDADKRLSDAKEDAKERAKEVDKLMRERLSSEKESDATLAHAVHIIEANAKLMERLERKMET